MKIYVCRMCLAPLYKRSRGAYCADCDDFTLRKNLSPKQIVDREVEDSLRKEVVRA